MKRTMLSLLLLIAIAALALPVLGFECGLPVPKTAGNHQHEKILLAANAPASKPSDPKLIHKVKIAYNGSTCEAPLYAAYHKGFFREQGVDVELVKMDFETLKEGLATGKVDFTQGNFKWLKPIEQGLKVKLAAGVHNGCIQAVVPKNSPIKSIKDLKGKTIGVEAIGGGPMILLSIELEKHGIDYKKDVSWKAYPGPQMEQAIAKGEIDAFGIWDPWGQLAQDKGTFRRIFASNIDKPYKDLYCCFLAVRADLPDKDPALAQAVLKAWLKGVEWVGKNPREAAKIEIDNKYTGGDVELNARLIGSYKWQPGVKRAESDLKYYIKEEKAQGILLPTTDEKKFFERVFARILPDYKGN
jgi:NitT/TauT family transport system substrate-binding protein